MAYGTEQDLLADLDAVTRLFEHIQEYIRKYRTVYEEDAPEGDWFLFAEGTHGPRTAPVFSSPSVRIGWHQMVADADLYEDLTLTAGDLMSWDPVLERALLEKSRQATATWVAEMATSRDTTEYLRLKEKLGL